MRPTAEFVRFHDGRHWACIEDLIDGYEKAAARGEPGAANLVRFLSVLLALAQETRPVDA